MTRYNRRGGQAGLTLIELLVSMIILASSRTMLIMGWINLSAARRSPCTANNARATAARRHRPCRQSSCAPRSPRAAAHAFRLGDRRRRRRSRRSPRRGRRTSSSTRPSTPPAHRRRHRRGGSAPHAHLAGHGHHRSHWTCSGTLNWQRDTQRQRSRDTGDRRIVLARNVVNRHHRARPANGARATRRLFRYALPAHRERRPVQWTDNTTGTLDLSGPSSRSAPASSSTPTSPTRPSTSTATTTVRLRNASGS